MSPRKVSVLASLGVLAVAAALLYGWYRSDLAAAQQRIEAGSEVVETACGAIEFAAAGEGPAVLLVHGAGGGFDQTLGAAQALAERGFRVIAPSRFGYLRTPQRSEATPAAQADAFACLLDALKVRRAAVIGISAGSPSALQFALRHAARTTGLVVLVPMVYAPQASIARPPAAMRWLFEGAVGSDFLFWLAARAAPQRLLGTPPGILARADAAEKARFSFLALQPLPVSRRREGLLNDAVIATHPQRYDLERIAAPMLVIAVRDDPFGTYERAIYTAQHVPGARFVGLPDGGHLWVGHQRELLGEVAEFLTRSAR